MAVNAPASGPIKAVFFDFMGTCLDWCTIVANALPPAMTHAQRWDFALNWRVAYFYENERRLREKLPIENIDETLARTLNQQLGAASYAPFAPHFSPEARKDAIAAWHRQVAWPDVAPALQAIRDTVGSELFVFGNGTTRLQLDLIRSSRLSFDLLFSSQMLGQLKPEPGVYRRAMALVDRRPEESAMVAAHVADLRGAKAVGMRTVYIRRETDDIHEDLQGIESEFDAVLDGMGDLAETLKKITSG